jgi:hypothetical protein
MDTIILERLKRAIEPDMCITPRSTPVIWFGDYDHARVCTISLNPSDKEFYKHPKKQKDYISPANLLSGKDERLCSRETLKKADHEKLTDADAEMAKDKCTKHFEVKPYMVWFGKLECFIKRFDHYSYFKSDDDTAGDKICVHLDLVQWASTPKWSALPEEIRQKHLDKDLPVLEYLLKKNFEIMFLNGTKVVENVSKQLGIKLESKVTSFQNTKGRKVKVIAYYGTYKKTKVVGWNYYIQSTAIGGYKNVDLLCDAVKASISV